VASIPSTDRANREPRSTPGSVRSAGRGARAVARRPEIEWLARAGLVARGVVYGVIGILALKLALGAGGKAASQREALETIAHEPLGEVLLIIVAAGVAGYAVWRLVTAAVGGRAMTPGWPACPPWPVASPTPPCASPR